MTHAEWVEWGSLMAGSVAAGVLVLVIMSVVLDRIRRRPL